MTLDQLALKHQTDKASNVHGYTKWYERHFEPLRYLPLTLFEASWGGYEYPDRGGQGAKCWREYFPNATIVSIDVHPKINIPEGIHFYQGSQDDFKMWGTIIGKHGRPDIFIADASHINSMEVRTMKIMAPMLNNGGWFVQEDNQTAYWSEIASDGTDFQGGLMRPGTTIEYAKEIMDMMQTESGMTNKFGFTEMHVYDKIIFFKKA